MNSILFVGCKLKEQLRIKRLLEGQFQVEANPSVHHSLSLIKAEPYDLVVYDTGNTIPLDYFLNSMSAGGRTLPLVLLADRIDKAALAEYRRRQIISVIKKPCNKAGLLNGITEGLAASRGTSAEAEASPPAVQAHRILQENASVMIGLRQNAVISGIEAGGLALQLPAAIADGTRIFFSNAEFFRVIGLPTPKQSFVSLAVWDCTETSPFRYDVRASLDEASEPGIAQAMQRFVAANAASRRVAASEDRTILIADRDSVTRNFFKAALENRGYRVQTAADGRELLVNLDYMDIDLVVTDLTLPTLGGIDLVQAIRKRESTVPVVVATGDADPGMVRMLSPLVQDFLPKPVSGRDLAQRVTRAFQVWDQRARADLGSQARFVDVSIETDLRVAFQDNVQLLGITPAGLRFARKQPIAAESVIVMRTKAISVSGATQPGAEASLQLLVERCSPYGKAGQYLVETAFST